jgi:hypothetical protein
MTTDLLLAAGIGLIGGLHVATWGMFKDAPHEGFARSKYVRAILLAGTLGIILQLATGLDVRSASGALVFFGIIYALERAVEEIYKTFLREQDQSKYFIPMQFHIQGRVVQNRAARWAVAAGCVAAGLAALAVVNAAEQAFAHWPPVAAILLVGGVGGWISAFGGAFKDAPIEGFETLKFFRSPALATAWAYLLAHIAQGYVTIALAAIGFTVATIETYKTFFFPSKPRGKFAGKPILFPEILRWRLRFVPLYAAIWLLLLVGWCAALTGRNGGLL